MTLHTALNPYADRSIDLVKVVDEHGVNRGFLYMHRKPITPEWIGQTDFPTSTRGLLLDCNGRGLSLCEGVFIPTASNTAPDTSFFEHWLEEVDKAAPVVMRQIWKHDEKEVSKWDTSYKVAFTSPSESISPSATAPPIRELRLPFPQALGRKEAPVAPKAGLIGRVVLFMILLCGGAMIIKWIFRQ